MRSLVISLAGAARWGRLILVLGLVAGIALPDLAFAMKPWIDECIIALLFIAALRVGPRQAVGALSDLGRSAAFAVALQVALPMLFLSGFVLFGFSSSLATGLVLMAAAPPISGSPNLTILSGHDPAPALRQLVAGTALLPATVIPVFWLAPAMGETSQVLAAAAHLLLVIGVAAAAAFLIRAFLLPHPRPDTVAAIDGLSAILMAVVVVGLMTAIGPAITADPLALALNLAAAFAVNFGLQIVGFLLMRRVRPLAKMAAPMAIVAGNRNIALFLTALPVSVTDPLLLFIGCYQIPMYLTPLFLQRLYRDEHDAELRQQTPETEE